MDSQVGGSRNRRAGSIETAPLVANSLRRTGGVVGGELTIPAYFAVKLAGYSMWCLVALRLAAGRAPGELGRAAVYGILRIVIGLVLGVSLVWIMPSIAPAANRAHFSIPVYVGALGILRIFEWIAVGGAIGMDMGLGRLAGPLGLLWVAAGVAISFLTDAVVIAFGIAVYDMPC